MSHRLPPDPLDAFVSVKWLTSVGSMGLGRWGRDMQPLFWPTVFFSSNFATFVKGSLDLSLCPRFHPLLSTSSYPRLSCGSNYLGGARPAPMWQRTWLLCRRDCELSLPFCLLVGEKNLDALSWKWLYPSFTDSVWAVEFQKLHNFSLWAWDRSLLSTCSFG